MRFTVHNSLIRLFVRSCYFSIIISFNVHGCSLSSGISIEWHAFTKICANIYMNARSHIHMHRKHGKRCEFTWYVLVHTCNMYIRSAHFNNFRLAGCYTPLFIKWMWWIFLAWKEFRWLHSNHWSSLLLSLSTSSPPSRSLRFENPTPNRLKMLVY